MPHTVTDQGSEGGSGPNELPSQYGMLVDVETSMRERYVVEVGENLLGLGPSEKGRVFPGRGNSMSKGSEACWGMCLHVLWAGW